MFALCVLLVAPLVQADETEGGVTVLQMGEFYASKERVDFVFVIGAFGFFAGVVGLALLLARKRED